MTENSIEKDAARYRWLRDRALPAPRRHCHIFAMAAFLGDSAEGNSRGQGFMTSANRFVERADALEIAKAAGQTRPGAALGHQLFSEDLW